MAHKRQHTIPRFYLKQFLSPGWCYRLGELNPHYHNSPSNVAVQKDYYGRSKSSSATLDDFNSFIETNCAPIFMKFTNPLKAITENDLIILSYLLANIYVRTPKIIEETQASELEAISTANIMAKDITQKLDEGKITAKQLFKLSLPELGDNSTSITLEQLNEYANKLRKRGGHLIVAKNTFYAFEDIAKSIQAMSMWIVEAPYRHFFITSDKPLTLRSRVTSSRVGAGWQNSDAMGLIALSPRYFLIMAYEEPSGIRITTATSEQVTGLNLETIIFANQEIYCTSRYHEAYNWMRMSGRWKPQG
jgi:hypothetical protein